MLSWTAGIGADWAFLVAVLVVAYHEGGALGVGALGLVRMVPATGVALFFTMPGTLSGERALTWINVVRGGGAAVAGLGLVTGLPFALTVFCAALVAGAGALVRPTHQALLPSMTRRPEELIAANVATSTGEGLGTFLGPAIAGAVLLVASPAAAMLLAAVMFGVAAVSVAVIRLPRMAAAVPDPQGSTRRPPIVSGFASLVRRPAAGVLIVGLGCQVLVRGLLTTLIVVASIELLGLGEGGVGALNAAIGAGGFLGAAAALGLAGRSRLALIYALCLTSWGLPIAFIGVVPNAPLALVAMIALGVSNALLDITAFTLLQRTLPNAERAPVFSFLEGVIGIGIAGGGILAPVLVAEFGVQTALVLTGLILPIAAAVTWPRVSRIDREGVVPDRQLRLLRDVPMFALLPLTMLERLASRLIPMLVPAGEVLMREGEPGDRFYIVASGALDVSSAGRRIGTSRAGDGIGEIALLRQLPRTATVVASEPSELYGLEGVDFLSVISEHLGNSQAADVLIDARLARSGGSAGG